MEHVAWGGEKVQQIITQTEFQLQVNYTCLRPIRESFLYYITVQQNRQGLGLVKGLRVGATTIVMVYIVTP